MSARQRAVLSSLGLDVTIVVICGTTFQRNSSQYFILTTFTHINSLLDHILAVYVVFAEYRNRIYFAISGQSSKPTAFCYHFNSPKAFTAREPKSTPVHAEKHFLPYIILRTIFEIMWVPTMGFRRRTWRW